MSAESSLGLSDLVGRRVVLWGFGVEGRAVHRLLSANPSTRLEIVVDERPDGLVVPEGVPLLWGEQGRRAMERAEVVVRSPGISIHRPDLIELARGRPVVGSMALWLNERQGRGVIGITGTKGKSTTAAFLAHLLETAGLPCRLGGNIGRPVVAHRAAAGLIEVVEVSSYQAADVSTSPEWGVLTSLYPEHLDWHGSYERYVADKLNLFAHGTGTLYVPESVSADQLDDRDAVVRVSPAAHPAAPGAAVPSRPGWLRAETVALAAAAAGSQGVSVSEELLGRAVASFGGLAHRQQLVVNGPVSAVDDTLATIPQATIDCLARLTEVPVSLIVGGQDRGVDQTPLVEFLRSAGDRVRVIGLPDTGHRLVAAVGGRAVDTIEEAVEWALARPRPDEHLVLSPAAASYNRHAGFTELAERFRRALGAAGLSSTEPTPPSGGVEPPASA